MVFTHTHTHTHSPLALSIPQILVYLLLEFEVIYSYPFSSPSSSSSSLLCIPFHSFFYLFPTYLSPFPYSFTGILHSSSCSLPPGHITLHPHYLQTTPSSSSSSSSFSPSPMAPRRNSPIGRFPRTMTQKVTVTS